MLPRAFRRMRDITEPELRGAGSGRPFATLWAGQMVSLLGDQITLIALPLLAASYSR